MKSYPGRSLALAFTLALAACSAPEAESNNAAADVTTEDARGVEESQAATEPATEPAEKSAPASEAQIDPKGRVIVLGFDGVDPDLAAEMMAAGELPNLAKLREQGTFDALESSLPPQSPTAWSSFTTGMHPGEHGVYDFLRRTPQNYLPGVGFGSVVNAQVGSDGSLAEAPRFENIRRGDSFWKIANENGARVKVLSVPFAFPAEDLHDSHQLCALGVPDIRGTTSTFFLLSEEINEDEELSGGVAVPLNFSENLISVDIEGLRNPSTRSFVSVPMTIERDVEENSVTLGVQGAEVTVNAGAWSDWVTWAFEVSDNYTVPAISRFYVHSAANPTKIYMSCLQFDPSDPMIRFTTPEDWGAELEERYGKFKTIGWIYDTHALRQGALTEEVFLEDVRKTMEWRGKLTLDEMDAGEFDLLVSAWTGPDRVGHMFWAYRDPEHPLYTAELNAKYGKAVEDTYRMMDDIVGQVMERLQENDLLMVMSDHGFHSFRRGFNVNTWLIRNGYLTAEGQENAETGTNMTPFLRGYDWSKSKAYSLGLGSIFLNQRGREGQGIVAPEDADALIAEIREKLLAVTDPETGDKVFTAVYTRDEYPGAAQGDAPDIQLGYAEGYQSTKDAAKGSAPAELFEDNLDKWSGEHAASDPATTAGILFANMDLAAEQPHLVDLGPTVLAYLGLEPPAAFAGESLLP